MKKTVEAPSFAFLCKEEVASREFQEEEIRPFLSAFCRLNGTFRISQGASELDLSCESARTAKTIYEIVKTRYGVASRFAYSRSMGFYRRTKYHCLVPNPDEILEDLEIDLYEKRRPLESVHGQTGYASYLMGAFCAAGSVNDPSSTNYHLEISYGDEREARWLLQIFAKASSGRFHPKIIKRRNQHVVYIKRAEEISDFLILVGATECCLRFEDVRVSRDFSNIGNRLNILDQANFKKAVESAHKQALYIEDYVERIGWEHVNNPKLSFLMHARLENMDATMGELAHMMSEEFATTISKSNINHLFRFLKQEYETHHGEN